MVEDLVDAFIVIKLNTKIVDETSPTVLETHHCSVVAAVSSANNTANNCI